MYLKFDDNCIYQIENYNTSTYNDRGNQYIKSELCLQYSIISRTAMNYKKMFIPLQFLSQKIIKMQVFQNF